MNKEVVPRLRSWAIIALLLRFKRVCPSIVSVFDSIIPFLFSNLLRSISKAFTLLIFPSFTSISVSIVLVSFDVIFEWLMKLFVWIVCEVLAWIVPFVSFTSVSLVILESLATITPVFVMVFVLFIIRVWALITCELLSSFEVIVLFLP